MENAKAYEYLVDESCGPMRGTSDVSAPEPVPQETPAAKEGDPPSKETDAPFWMGIINKLEQSHEMQREKMESKLESVKTQTSNYKVELRDNLKHRLQWLEQQVQKKQSSTSQGDSVDGSKTDSLPGVTQVSTFTTNGTRSTDSENLLNPVTFSNPRQAPTDSVEVTIDGAEATERLATIESLLERTQAAHDQERQEWVQTLDRAAALTASGQRLSKHMEDQVQHVSQEMHKAYSQQKKQWKEKTKVLEQLLALTEQQHEAEQNDWKQKLQQAQQKNDSLQRELVSLQTSVSVLEKQLEEATDAQVHAEETQAQLQEELALSKEREAVAQKQVTNLSTVLMQEDRRIPLSPSASPASTGILKLDPDASFPSRRVEWDDKLDRAMAERDIAQQELAQVKEELTRLHKDRGDDLSSVASEPQSNRFFEEIASLRAQIVEKDIDFRRKEEEIIERYESKIERIQAYNRDQLQIAKNAAKEVAALPVGGSKARLEQRLRESVDKKNELVAKLRKVEEQHADDRVAWKLKLETAISESRRLESEKELAGKQEATDSPGKRMGNKMNAVFSTAAKGTDDKDGSGQLEALRRDHEAEVLGLKGNLDVLKSRVDEMQRDKLRIVAEHEARVDALNQDLKDLHQRFDKAKTDKAVLMAEHEEHTKSLDEKIERLEEAQIEALTVPKVEMEKMSVLQARLDAANSDISRMRTEHESRLDELESENKRLHECIATHEEATIARETQSKDLAEVCKRLKDAEARQTRLKSEYGDQVKLLQDEKENLESRNKEMMAEIDSLKSQSEEKLSSANGSHKSELEDIHQRHNSEMIDLRRELNLTEERLETAEAQHKADLELKQEALQRARGETDMVLERTNTLSKSLEDLRETHRIARVEWNEKMAELERQRDAIRQELEASKQIQAEGKTVVQHVATIESQHQTLRNSMAEISTEIANVLNSVREESTASSVAGRSMSKALAVDFENVKATLSDAVIAMSGGTETLVGGREDLKVLIGKMSAVEGIILKQDEVVSILGSLCSEIQGIKAQDFSEDLIRSNARLETTLQIREDTLAELDNEVTRLKEEISMELRKRERAEEEIVKLNDQADAYSEELMRLQAVNTGLESTLRIAEKRMEAVLKKQENSEEGQLSSIKGQPSIEEDAPLLEEALALAEGLTDIVHGNGSNDHEDNVMSMLESMSELMEQHDSRSIIASSSSVDVEESGSPLKRHLFLTKADQSVEVDLVEARSRNPMDQSRQEPEPVNSPMNSHDQEDTSKLGLFVDQLYGRCQLLERERTELMEVSLELLQTAKESSAAELDAALVSAQRKASEEIEKVRQKNQQDQWRIYHRLCGKCQRGMLEGSKE